MESGARTLFILNSIEDRRATCDVKTLLIVISSGVLASVMEHDGLAAMLLETPWQVIELGNDVVAPKKPTVAE